MNGFSTKNNNHDKTQNISYNSQISSKFLELIIYILFLLGPLTGNVINVLFHVLSAEFDVSLSALLVTIPSFMFPFAITQLFSGSISDIKGRVPVLIFGLALFGVAMILAAVSINLIMYAIANVLGGIGFGFINPILIALMTDITAPPNIPKKMGYLGASAALGVGLGPFIASQLILISWRSIYILFVVITLFCLIYFIIAKRPPQKVPEESGIHVLLKQLSIEWRRLVVILMMLSAFLIAYTYIAINIWTSKEIAGIIEESLTGVILGLAGVGGAIMGALTGFLIKKKGVKMPFIIGSVLLLISLIIFLTLGDITRSGVFLIFAISWIVAGLAGGILFPLVTYYSQVLSPDRRGALAGSVTASYFIGIALVPTVLAPFSDNFGITGVYLAILV
ncbi:MAG: MFS transporter, partial [Promethearchaeota archaeon]